MNTPSFAIAKFIPDLRRMEPRNFGVVVWNRGVCLSRFIGDKAEDAKDFAKLAVESKDTYLQWLEYWRLSIAKNELRTRSGEVVSKTSPDFLSVLCATSKDHFILANAGLIADKVAPSKTAALMDSLYRTIVVHSNDKRSRTNEYAEVLRKEASRAIDSSGISEVDGFFNKYEFLCPIGETTQHFTFHFGIAKKKPKAVLHRVNIHSQSSVNDAAFMFTSMQGSGVAQDMCAAIVHADEDDLKENDVYQSFNLMKTVGNVINVAHHTEAVRDLSNVATKATSA